MADLLVFIIIVIGLQIFFGTLVLLPTAFVFTVVATVAVSSARVHKSIAAAVLLLSALIAGYLWNERRARYLDKAAAMAHHISRTPKLGAVKNVPDAILVNGFPFPEMAFGRATCFPQLFGVSRSGKGASAWDRQRGWIPETLPSRYMYFDTNDEGSSSFGKRSATSRRGPYELWLIEGNKRLLVDVFFMADDGRGWFPSPFFWDWLSLGRPASISNAERGPIMAPFLDRTTGQCSKQPGS